MKRVISLVLLHDILSLGRRISSDWLLSLMQCIDHEETRADDIRAIPFEILRGDGLEKI